jgi:hypothetical protein
VTEREARTALLERALDAHGGLLRWQRMHRAQGTVETDGLLLETKNPSPNSAPLRFAVAMHEVWASLQTVGSGPRIDLTTERIAIVANDGTVVAQDEEIRTSFAGHDMATPWNPLQRGFFGAYALWNYLNLPFLLTLPEIELHQAAAVEVDGQMLAGIGAVFPATLPTHSHEQQFFFDADGLLRRHDYHLDIAGGAAVNHYVGDYVNANGINVPTVRRAYLCDARGQTCWDQLLVHLRFSDIRFDGRP